VVCWDLIRLDARILHSQVKTDISKDIPGAHEGYTDSTTASDQTFEFALRCLDECTSTHTKCFASASPGTWRPTRLVDLGPIEEPLKASLLICGDHPPELPYTTLSHRWGSAEVFQLTLHTISEMVDSIPVTALPKTFQEAFEFAKRLGFRYMWIDSLCIIQDSIEDWQKEAITMGNVYANAQCNISATGALDTEQGLFFERNPMLVNPCKIKLNWSGPWVGGSYYLLDPLI